MQCACTTYRHLWLVRLYDIFLRCLLKDKIFGKNVFKKTCFDFPLQLWSATFLTLRRIQRDVIINVHRSSNRTLWSIVRRMEVDCENKTFAAAGMLCPSELGTLVPRRSGKWDKQGNYANRATEMYNNGVPNWYMWHLRGSQKECLECKFMVAGTQCQRELGTFGRRRSEKGLIGRVITVNNKTMYM